MKIKVRLCRLARQHHQRSARSFAHVFHHSDTICVTPEFYDLPQGYRFGILLHEFGHLAHFRKQHTEYDADVSAFNLSGVTIQRRTYHEAQNLEYVPRSEWAEARRFLSQHLTTT